MNIVLPRLDRLLTLYFFFPLTRGKSQYREHRIPILMYHSISEYREKRVHPYYETTTYPEVFAQHMAFLHDNKYLVTPLHDLVTGFQSQEDLHKKSVFITFDDGLRDFYLNAFPVLDKYNFVSTMFVSTAFMSKQRKRFNGKECLTWNEVRELHGKGVVFGSHTVTHPQLNMLDKNGIIHEVRRSKEQIEDQIGESIESFSYPFAFPEEDKKFVRFLRARLQDAGYTNGVSTRIGATSMHDDIFFLKRIPVNSFDDPVLFKAKLEGGFDWLYTFQYFIKLLKRIRKNFDRDYVYRSST